MAILNIENVDEDLLAGRRVRAARHGVSTEEEARQILRRAIAAGS